MLRDTFAVVPPQGSFPLNRHNFLLSKIFVDAFSAGEALNRETAVRIAEDQMSLAPSYDRRQWDAAPQSKYLHAVDLLLLADEYDMARQMIEKSRGLNGRHVKELAQVTRLIARSGGVVADDEPSRAVYRQSFDRLRDPAYPDSLRGHPACLEQLLIMACIWQKYFDPGHRQYSVERAFELVRE
jgi:hypothetical protein